MDNREKQIRLAEQLIATGIDGELKKAIENQFPELKESEDEKISKALLWCLETIEGELGIKTFDGGVSIGELKTYLEKQKEPYSPLCNTIKDKIREYIANHFIADTVVKTDMKSIVKAMEEGVRLGKEEQKPAEWSEEDAEMLERCIDSIKSYRDYYAAKDPDSRRVDDKYNPYNVEIKWLKFLRPWSHWKPSEKQIGALKQWLQDKQYDGDSRYVYPILESLCNDLQKLL